MRSNYQQVLRDEEGWHNLRERAAQLRARARAQSAASNDAQRLSMEFEALFEKLRSREVVNFEGLLNRIVDAFVRTPGNEALQNLCIAGGLKLLQYSDITQPDALRFFHIGLGYSQRNTLFRQLEQLCDLASGAGIAFGASKSRNNANSYKQIIAGLGKIRDPNNAPSWLYDAVSSALTYDELRMAQDDSAASSSSIYMAPAPLVKQITTELLRIFPDKEEDLLNRFSEKTKDIYEKIDQLEQGILNTFVLHITDGLTEIEKLITTQDIHELDKAQEQLELLRERIQRVSTLSANRQADVSKNIKSLQEYATSLEGEIIDQKQELEKAAIRDSIQHGDDAWNSSEKLLSGKEWSDDIAQQVLTLLADAEKHYKDAQIYPHAISSIHSADLDSRQKAVIKLKRKLQEREAKEKLRYDFQKQLDHINASIEAQHIKFRSHQ